MPSFYAFSIVSYAFSSVCLSLLTVTTCSVVRIPIFLMKFKARLCEFSIYDYRDRVVYRLTFSSTRLQPELEYSSASLGMNSKSLAMVSTSCSVKRRRLFLALHRMHILTWSRSSGRKGTTTTFTMYPFGSLTRFSISEQTYYI